MQKAYLYHPALGKDNIFFVTENSLWSIPIVEGGNAKKIVSGEGSVNTPLVSPDGKWVAFAFNEEGSNEIYIMPSEGGSTKRLTFHNTSSIPVGWSTDSKTIYFKSSLKSPFARTAELFSISIEGGDYTPMGIGKGDWINFHKDGNQALIGKYSSDLSYWKRYKGGTAGQIWYGTINDLNFKEILKHQAGHVLPQFDGDRVVFITDKDGIANVYSCDVNGENITQHTHNKDYYIRNLSVRDGKAVYQSAGDIYLLDLRTNESKKLEINPASPLKPEKNYFTATDAYIQDMDICDKGNSTMFTVRGKLVHLPLWSGASRVVGKKQGVRYRLSEFLNEDDDIITVSDEGDGEQIEIHYDSYLKETEIVARIEKGRVLNLMPSPDGKYAVVTTSENKMFILDIEKKKFEHIDTTSSAYMPGWSPNWSPDNRYIAYTKVPEDSDITSVYIYDMKEKDIISVTDGEFSDTQPVFDPEGKYLYFVSERYLNPHMDHRDLMFSNVSSSKPYLVVLDKDTPLPFIVPHEPEQNKKKDKKKKKEEKEEKKIVVKIDKEGLQNRIFEFPVDASAFYMIVGLKNKVMLGSVDRVGMLDWNSVEKKGMKLELYDFVENRLDPYMTDIQSFKVSKNAKWMIYRTKGKYHFAKAGEKQSPSNKDDKPSRVNGGAIDTSRIRIKVELKSEWKQIFKEIWKFTYEFFWNEDLSGVDWERVRKLYEPLIDKVNTREELNDLLWEVQGELGTSHAYIYGGDLQRNKGYKVGLLGADFEVDADKNLYKVSKIYEGDTFYDKKYSPLRMPGVNVGVGEYIHAVNGEAVDSSSHPYEKLINMANNEVVLIVSKTGDIKDAREVTVRTISSEAPLIYRDWVKNNINYVAEKTNGEAGYFHIPNMSTEGLIEFDRYFYQFVDKKGLVLDLRCNGGGFVSQNLLQRLYRKLVAFNNSRWGNEKRPETMPSNTFRGSLVVIIDQHAGSDGDIFPQSFKNLEMGTVVGKRTWGGVVGINGSKIGGTVDRGGSTHPEFAIWFVKQRYGVENHGVDPDIEVENDPKSVNEGKDNQLDVALEELKKLMDKNGYYTPDWGDIPKTSI